MKTKSGLTALFNEKVVSVTRVTRPLAGYKKEYPSLKLYHAGVLVTTDQGNTYLIHKGDGYGKCSQTVVVRASHMSSLWTRRETVTVTRKLRVGDFVKVAGANYSLLRDNCQDAVRRMMRLAKGERP